MASQPTRVPATDGAEIGPKRLGAEISGGPVASRLTVTRGRAGIPCLPLEMMEPTRKGIAATRSLDTRARLSAASASVPTPRSERLRHQMKTNPSTTCFDVFEQCVLAVQGKRRLMAVSTARFPGVMLFV
jgi:hypothetical protein